MTLAASVEAPSGEKPLPRLARLRQAWLEQVPSICSERALLVTASFQETEGLPMIVRRARALERVLREMTIFIEDGQQIVGNQASRGRAAPIFPEYSIDWVIEELDRFERRPGDVFAIDGATKAQLRGIHAYWKGRTHQDQVRRSLTPLNILAEQQGVIHRGGISMSGDGHIIPNHERVLNRGLGAHLARAEAALDRLDPADPAAADARDFFQAARIALRAAIEFSRRFAQEARRLEAHETDPQRRHELLELAGICERVPESPARTFHEALQVVYLCHLIMMIESNGHSFSFGRFDQYLAPFYESDLRSGAIDRERALELLALFCLKLNTLNKVRPWDHTEFGVGYPLYSNLMVGGMKPDGSDGTNDLTHLCLEAIDQVRLPEPNFSVRFWAGSPRRLLVESARLIRRGFGMPSLFADETVIPALRSLGIPEPDARDYASMGCVEVAIPGCWTHRATGMTYLNFGKILELVLHNGVDPRTGIQLLSVDGTRASRARFDTYEAVFVEWKRFLSFYTDLAVESDEVCDRSLEIHDADPFASSLVDECLDRGRTLKQGGARYDFVSQSTVGPTTVGDSLAAIRHLVFDYQKVSFPELMEALDSNWAGPQGARLRALARAAPKFGNDQEPADRITASVYESYLDLLPKYHTRRQGRGPFGCGYTMSTSNISSNVPYGMDVGATPDGRAAGEPLNEGASPCRGADREGPTAVLKSLGRLPNRRMAGGQLLNMKLSPALLDSEEKLDKFVSFLEAFRVLGGFHIQFNLLDRATLLDARAHPEHYPNLMVRVAGYCALFTSLMPEVQDDIIQRTEHVRL